MSSDGTDGFATHQGFRVSPQQPTRPCAAPPFRFPQSKPQHRDTTPPCRYLMLKRGISHQFSRHSARVISSCRHLLARCDLGASRHYLDGSPFCSFTCCTSAKFNRERLQPQPGFASIPPPSSREAHRRGTGNCLIISRVSKVTMSSSVARITSFGREEPRLFQVSR